ncbi:Protein kinase, AMP-activated, beta, partial [Perkinsus olseni]
MYDGPEPFEGQNVCIIGTGPSSADIAYEVGMVAKSMTVVGRHHKGEAMVSTRGYEYYFPFLDGIETDVGEHLLELMMWPNDPTLIFIGLPSGVFSCICSALEVAVIAKPRVRDSSLVCRDTNSLCQCLPSTPSLPRPSGDVAQPPTHHGADIGPAVPVQSTSPSSASDRPRVPVMFRWNGDGHRVSLVGTFNNWRTHLPMVRSGQEFYQIVEVPRGFHQYAFDVDGEMKYASEQPVTHEDDGTILNYIDLTNYRPYVPQPLG